jgi:signal transduction histidine kinase
VMGSLMLLDNVQESSDRESSRPANYPHDAPHDAPQERDGILMPRPLLQRMIQSGRMQLNRLNMLLEAYTNVASGLVLKAQLVSLDRVVQQAVEELSPLIEKNQVRLLNQMAYPCPEIWADTERLRQVFIQLLTNAIKHNPPGVEVRLESTLIEGTHPQDSIVRLTISDNGLGIDPIEQGDLFELRLKPQQERQLTPISLGLCLCKQIVTAHGGQITLNSRPGAGTRVELALPVNFRLSRNHYN